MVELLTYPAVLLTLKVSAISMVLQCVIGVPVGLYLAGERSIGRQVADIAVSLPMIFPPMALGFFLLLVFGKNGMVGSFILSVFGTKIIFSFWGVLIAVFTVGFPFMAKSVQASRQQLDQTLIDAACTLGKSNWQIVWYVVLPNIKKGIVAGLLLSFGRSLGEVGISLMLGGNIINRTETLSLAIYNAVFEGDFEKASQLSALLTAISVAVLIIINHADIRSVMSRFKRTNLNGTY